MYTLYDTEDGDPLCVLAYEVRKDNHGNTWPSPKPHDPRSYCERQIAPKDQPALVDEQGAIIDGP